MCVPGVKIPSSASVPVTPRTERNPGVALPPDNNNQVSSYTQVHTMLCSHTWKAFIVKESLLTGEAAASHRVGGVVRSANHRERT